MRVGGRGFRRCAARGPHPLFCWAAGRYTRPAIHRLEDVECAGRARPTSTAHDFASAAFGGSRGLLTSAGALSLEDNLSYRLLVDIESIVNITLLGA